MLLYVLFVLTCASAHSLQVNTTEGVVEGAKAADGDYYVFYGIPYAGPSSGANRFKGPVRPPKRPGVLHANVTNVICAQPTARELIGVEDCLTLSIFTKHVTTRRPVIVWLNAEEYTTTYTQSFSYRSFVDEDVVFVTLNFRLSIFGFLCLGVKEAPGNAGLKDVIQGLKWIQANIANFGGNPNNVVLMGHGSGAAMIDLLTIIPQTKKLVHKAIALSGSGLAPWAVSYDPIGYAELLGAKLGYSGETHSQLAKHLTTTNITVLHTALNDFKFHNNTPLFAPCIENYKLKGAVLTDAPIDMLRLGNYAHIPYVYGYTTLEGMMRAGEAINGDWLSAMQANFENFLPIDLKGKVRTTVATNIRDFYFGDSPISMDTIRDYLDYEGDTLIVVSVIRAARERALTSRRDVRLLEFGYLGTQNSDWIHNQIPVSGVKHGGFLNFLFNYDLRPVDEAVGKSLVMRLTGFAHNWLSTATGKWTYAWKAITKETTNYLYYGGNEEPIADQTSIYVEEAKVDPHQQRMSFWNSLYAKHYVPPRGLITKHQCVFAMC